MILLRFVVVAALLAPLTVSAADLPVSYLVEAKPLKAAVAGTPLTFELYTDSACSGPVAHSQVVNIEDTRLLVELKPVNPKNAVKKSKTVEVREDLKNVQALDANPYLKVTGPGVVPLGPACQVQAALLAEDSLGFTAVPIEFDAARIHWKVTNPAVVLGAEFSDPTYIMAMSSSVAGKLKVLDASSVYNCNMTDYGIKESVHTGTGQYLQVYAIKSCLALP